MYIINTQFKPSNTGGMYKCTVHLFYNINTKPRNITEEVAIHHNLKYAKGYILISHGSGTGAMVLESLLSNSKQVNPKSPRVFDISI